MAFANFSPGSYTVSYGGNDMGLVHRPSILRAQTHGIPISVDLYGNAVVDYIYRAREVYVMCTFAEWSANLRSMMNPFGSAHGDIGLVGRLASDIAASLVLTPVASTPAATLGNNTFTFSKALVAPQNNIEYVLGNVERNIPVMFLCLLFDASGTKRHFAIS